jgi:hypothetical protein
MSIDFARSTGRRRGRIAGVVAAGAAVLSLAIAAPAWAAPEATATVAPIGTGGSYLVTLKNTGSEAITNFYVETGEPLATNVVPSPACMAGNSPATGSIACNATVAPGVSAQMCYTGNALLEVLPGASMLVTFAGGTSAFIAVSPSPAVASCPLPGFKSPSPLKCKKGFKKKTVHGKTKCVKVKKKHKH